MLLRISGLVGLATDAELAERLHTLSHRGQVETLTLPTRDLARRRLRANTDAGTECAIALPRSQALCNGAVLVMEEERAVVVRVVEQPWLTLEARDSAAALELGFLAGHHHWRVRIDGIRLHVALEGPPSRYLDRIQGQLREGTVRVIDGVAEAVIDDA